MSRFTCRPFYGVAPKVAPRSLGEGFAQEASNVDLSLPVQIRPLRGNQQVQALETVVGGVKQLHLYEDQHWFQFADADTDVVKGPLAEDATARVYITDSAHPKTTRNDLAISSTGIMPAATYRLGVPAPTSAPTTTVSGTGDADNQTNTAYVYTYVTSWGEEGPPSDPSAVITVNAGQTVTVGVSAPPTGAYSWNLIRIYRLNPGNVSTEFQFVAEIPHSTSSYADTKLNDELGEIIPSVTWHAPPDENYPTGPLRGILALPNGSLAGFTGPTFCMSEAYLPHAWPFEYRYPIDRDIVAISRVPQGVILLTDAMPYLATGTDPSSISLVPLPESQACRSKQSVVDMGGYTIYASPEGLVGVDGGSVRVLTSDLFREEQWRALFNPDSILGFYWEGRYVGFYNTGTVAGGFIFNPGDGQASFSHLTAEATAGHYDNRTDQLYLNIGENLVVFSHPDEVALSYTWHSKEFQAPVPMPMAAVRVIGEGTVTVEVWADNLLVSTDALTIDGYETVRLPPGYRAKEWSVRLQGTANIDQVDLVTAVLELQE